MKEYIKIDRTGAPIDSVLLGVDDPIPEDHVLPWPQDGRIWWSPVYVDGVWAEGLSEKDIADKNQAVTKEKAKPTDDEINAMALMELTQAIMKGGL